jgi:glutathione S-transferase
MQHYAHQPFGQVPWLTDGDISIFESGAILLHRGELSDKLMPADARGRSTVKEWLSAALASVEAASQPWSFFKFSGDTDETPMRKFFNTFLEARLKHMETVLAGREWLVGAFSIADILMADVLRLVDRFDGLSEQPACRAYVLRATSRPAFAKAHADQMAHFAAAA